MVIIRLARLPPAPGWEGTVMFSGETTDSGFMKIAAAPELAAALRKVTDELSRWICNESNEDPWKNPAVLEAEALLKRIDEGAT